MNLIPSLDKLLGRDSVEELDAKQERIEWHRRHVRNGPVVTLSDAVLRKRLRRQHQRDIERNRRKVRKAQVRYYKAAALDHAILRGKLQAAGMLPRVGERRTSTTREEALAWIIVRFNDVDELSDESISVAVEKAIEQYQRGVAA